jgi:hypothetical protein
MEIYALVEESSDGTDERISTSCMEEVRPFDNYEDEVHFAFDEFNRCYRGVNPDRLMSTDVGTSCYTREFDEDWLERLVECANDQEEGCESITQYSSQPDMLSVRNAASAVSCVTRLLISYLANLLNRILTRLVPLLKLFLTT